MKSLSKSLLGFLLRYSGLSLLVRNTVARNKVGIMVYHDPQPEDLERHLNYLTRRYSFITLERLVNALYTQDWSGIPPKSLVITIDDGHKGNFHLLRVFQKYKVVPTIFLCTQIVTTNRRFWWKVVGQNPKSLKEVTNKERLKFLEGQYGFVQTAEVPTREREALNLEEITAMKDYVDFQSHSRFHPLLSRCTAEESAQEIVLSKAEVENLSGKPCRHFCYPGGRYSAREIQLAKKVGYLSARTIEVGWNDRHTDPYRLKRIGVADDASTHYLAAQMTGLVDLLKVKVLKIAGPEA